MILLKELSPHRAEDKQFMEAKRFFLGAKEMLRDAEKHMDVSENSGTPKSSILIGFSTINHPFWGTPIFGNTHIYTGVDPWK